MPSCIPLYAAQNESIRGVKICQDIQNGHRFGVQRALMMRAVVNYLHGWGVRLWWQYVKVVAVIPMRISACAWRCSMHATQTCQWTILSGRSNARVVALKDLISKRSHMKD